MDWRHALRVKTQRPDFLWKMVIFILASGVVAGMIVQLAPVPRRDRGDRLAISAAHGNTEDMLGLLDTLMADGELPFEKLLEALRYLKPTSHDIQVGDALASVVATTVSPEQVRERLVTGITDPARQEIALRFWQEICEEKGADGLLELTRRTPPVRYANHALGLFWLEAGDQQKAAQAFEREGRLPTAVLSRREAVRVYLSCDDTQALRRLMEEPDFASEIPTAARMRIAADNRDWWTVWWQIPHNEWDRFSWPAALLALFAGVCWFVFAIQAGQAHLSQGARGWLCGLAVILGMLSIWPTHWLILWQETVWGLVERDDLIGGLKYYVMGVGLREELCKFCLLVPLLPWLVRRRNELEVLIVAACTGLGFAMVENEHYFAGTYGSSSVGRFLTANFFHMAATGLIGLAAVRGIWSPRYRGVDALALFCVVVFAHGVYDAAISIPAMADFFIVSPIVYILLSYQFFHELRSLRSRRTETVSLTATFLCGVSLLTSVTFVFLSAQFGCTAAARILIPQVISMGLMVYMFLREMPNSLVRV